MKKNYNKKIAIKDKIKITVTDVYKVNFLK
jgi:hypothetical protein